MAFLPRVSLKTPMSAPRQERSSEIKPSLRVLLRMRECFRIRGGHSGVGAVGEAFIFDQGCDALLQSYFGTAINCMD
jgi:hypothetical protein